MTYSLKPIINDKFWIVEFQGQKHGTLRYVDGELYEVSSNGKINMLDKAQLTGLYGIDIENYNYEQPETIEITRNTDEKHVDILYEYPCAGVPFNGMYDVKKKLPMYTKTSKSSSYHCAGYYVIEYENGWTRAFCPKLVTLTKYQYKGPYKTKDDMLAKMRQLNKK